MNTPPTVIWSNHAVERGEERFGDCTQLTFPDEIIQAVGSLRPVGDTFKIGQAGIIYVCVRADENTILVKTIHASETFVDTGSRSNGRLATDPHNRAIRRRLDSRERRSRASVKRELEQLYLPSGGYNAIRAVDSPTDLR